MNITIYIDIFFLWNLIVDYTILSIIALVRKQKAKKLRRLLGALTGSTAAAGLLVCFRDAGIIHTIICYVVTAAFILVITFGASTKKLFIKNYLFFILTADCAAGILMSLGIFSDLSIPDLIKGYNSGTGNILSENTVYMFFYVMSYVIPILIFFYYRIKQPEDESLIYEVIIKYQQKDWHGIGFLDTGNLLVNPVNGKPVILLEKKYFEELIGNGFIATEDAMLMLPEMCVVPFCSAGEPNGMLYGVRISEIMIIKNSEKWHSLGIVAACCENLIPKEKGYQLLLNPKLIV